MDVAGTHWLLIASLALPALGFAIWRFSRQRKQSERLRHRFGVEYDHAAVRLGGRRKAEAELKSRERLAEREGITVLTVFDVERVGVAWNILQRRFVDHPEESLVAAERLVREVLQRRGYRITEPTRGGADASVDRASIVEAYCKERDLSANIRWDQEATEDVRRAVLRYRALLNELLEVCEARELPAPQERLVASDANFGSETLSPTGA